MSCSTSKILCRLCCLIIREKGYDLFDETCIKIGLREKIEFYLHIKVSVFDKITTVVCESCFNQLEDTHKFGLKAMQSQMLLGCGSSDVSMKALANRALVLSLPNLSTKEVEEIVIKVDPSAFWYDSSSDGITLSEEESDEDKNATKIFEQIVKKSRHSISNSAVKTEALTPNLDTNHNATSDDVNSSDSSSYLKTKQINLFTDTKDDTENKNLNTYPKIKLPHTCRMCNKTFYNTDLYEFHLNAFLGVHPVPKTKKNRLRTLYNCVKCGAKFKSKLGHLSHLEKYIKNHGGTEIYNGDHSYTNQSIMHNDAIDNEMCEAAEEGRENFVINDDNANCPVCSKVIPRHNLIVHLQAHRPKGSFTCSECGRIFKTNLNLLRHMDSHSGQKFTCETCARVYPTMSTLKAHMITHSNLRPHKCDVCEKTFKRNQDLKFHLNQHTGERPFQCPYCPKAFASSGNCFSHRKRMHPVEMERDRELATQITTSSQDY